MATQIPDLVKNMAASLSLSRDLQAAIRNLTAAMAGSGYKAAISDLEDRLSEVVALNADLAAEVKRSAAAPDLSAETAGFLAGAADLLAEVRDFLAGAADLLAEVRDFLASAAEIVAEIRKSRALSAAIGREGKENAAALAVAALFLLATLLFVAFVSSN